MALIDPSASGLQLRCALQECQAINVADVTTTVLPGQFGRVNGMPVIYVTSRENSLSEFVAALFYAPKIFVPCVAVPSGGFLPGSKVYHDNADGEVNQSSTGNVFCGIVLEQPETGDEQVLIAFDGRLGL